MHAFCVPQNRVVSESYSQDGLPAPDCRLCFPAGWRSLMRVEFDRAMPHRSKNFLRFLGSWAINTLAVVVAVVVLHGHIRYQKPVDLIVASLLLGVLNAFVRPILLFFALPLVIFTLGLFTFVINALLLYLVGVLMSPPFRASPHFQVDSFGFAFLGALIISFVSLVLHFSTGGARVTVRRRPPPPSPSDNGPVIDV
jgi:putative membrane protein